MSDGFVVASCGLKVAHRLEVAGVGDDFGEFLELIELAQFRGGRGFERWRCS